MNTKSMGRNTIDSPFWSKNWPWVSAVVLLVTVLSVFGQFKSADHFLFDFFSKLAPATAQSQIALIHIENGKSSAPGIMRGSARDQLARLIRTIEAGHPKIIAVTTPLDKPHDSPGFIALEKLIALYKSENLEVWKQALESTKGDRSAMNPAQSQKITTDLDLFYTHLIEAKNKLDHDTQLAHAIADGKTVDIALRYSSGISQGIPSTDLPSRIAINTLSPTIIQADPPGAYSLSLPLVQFMENAAAVGVYINANDSWSRYSGIPLSIQYQNRALPSLALIISMQSLGIPSQDITYRKDFGLTIGNTLIRTSDGTKIHPRSYRNTSGKNPAFIAYSSSDIISGNVSTENFKDKIVLVGYSGLTALASQVSGILNHDLIYTPRWGIYAQISVWILIALYLLFLSPLLRNILPVIAFTFILSTLLAVDFYLFKANNAWVSPTESIFLLMFGEIGATFKRRLANNTRILPNSKSNLENIRLLGIAFQSQGQLDLAYDRFRHLPINDESLELLYGLALDYERRRKFEKAKAIYENIARHRKNYRDVRERMKRTQTLTEISLSTPSNENTEIRPNNGTMIIPHSGLQKPMLGRYEIEHEIGRGAMSIVYEGKDPKIGRRVAVKTLPLSTEFQGEDLKNVKSRFYREAETAGQLSHPNIVTIYDAGEEDDIAYIAMEFLHGTNLTSFTAKKDLLPIVTTLEIIAKCALALDYAHKHQVIHRDIKPANIVYNVDTGDVKLTDFGIARITDASKTRTGVIMGTPSYMSPEQLAGRQLDGRSDLFSLAITGFQLLTGALPFNADTMATLMYKITNEAHPALNALRSDLSPCVSPIINKGLQKNPEKRFQSGREFANQLLRCIRNIKDQTNEY